MKANELRIGNFVQAIFHDKNSEIKNFYNVCKICNISEQGISANRVFPDDSTSYTGSFEPIPLTEEWLLKFGFENHIINEHTIYQNNWKKGFLTILWRKYGTYYDFSTGRFIIGSISFVHQLQNLYFALTGEELTIDKEETK